MEKNISSNPNTFWSYINNIKNTTAIPNVMNHNGITMTDPQQIVNAFAEFFETAYISPQSNQSNDEPPISAPIFTIQQFTEADTLKALKKMKPKLITGPDGIPAFLVKDCANILAVPLSIIFNLSIETSTFPEIWKTSKICPVYKKNEKQEVSNYRPIVILCNFSKAFEILLHESVSFHVKSQICINQHGFTPGRSTSTNLLYLTQYTAEVLDMGGQVDIIYTDFSKAFDRLNHDILLKKLSFFGFSPSLIEFFKSYLIERHQFVLYRGFKSNVIHAKSGVPQGSVLGPLLFNIFVNDIVSRLNCNSLLYADDMKIFTSINCEDDSERLQNDLDNLQSWCDKNELPLNCDKCYTMSFSRKQDLSLNEYVINNTIILRRDKLKDLGVTFDTKLTFNDHIAEITASAYKKLGFIIRNSKGFENSNTLFLLFNAFVRSKLEYASIIWNPAYQIHKNNIEGTQRHFLKYLYFREEGIYPPRGFPHEELLSKFHVPDLNNRRIFSSCVFLHKLINFKFDSPQILEMIKFHTPTFQTRSYNLFYLSTPRTNLLKHSPLHVMCSNFNSLPRDIDIFNCKINDLKQAILNN